MNIFNIYDPDDWFRYELDVFSLSSCESNRQYIRRKLLVLILKFENEGNNFIRDISVNSKNNVKSLENLNSLDVDEVLQTQTDFSLDGQYWSDPEEEYDEGLNILNDFFKYNAKTLIDIAIGTQITEFELFCVFVGQLMEGLDDPFDAETSPITAFLSNNFDIEDYFNKKEFEGLYINHELISALFKKYTENEIDFGKTISFIKLNGAINPNLYISNKSIFRKDDYESIVERARELSPEIDLDKVNSKEKTNIIYDVENIMSMYYEAIKRVKIKVSLWEFAYLEYFEYLKEEDIKNRDLLLRKLLHLNPKYFNAVIDRPTNEDNKNEINKILNLLKGYHGGVLNTAFENNKFATIPFVNSTIIKDLAEENFSFNKVSSKWNISDVELREIKENTKNLKRKEARQAHQILLANRWIDRPGFGTFENFLSKMNKTEIRNMSSLFINFHKYSYEFRDIVMKSISNYLK